MRGDAALSDTSELAELCGCRNVDVIAQLRKLAKLLGDEKLDNQ